MANTSNDSVTMTYSSLLLKNGKKAICVRYERSSLNGVDFAELLLPECNVTAQKGFTEDELVQLKFYTKANKDDILQKSKGISNIMHWF